MKKLILLAAIAGISTGATAQFNFGAQIGGNLANIKSEATEPGSRKETDKTKFGFLIGVVAEVPLSGSLSFRPELNFIQKGAKYNLSFTYFGITSVITGEETLNFIELPLNIVYSIPVGNGHIFFGAGPTIGYGISGKYKSTIITTEPGFPDATDLGSGNVKFDGKKAADLSNGDIDSHLKPVDFGGNILAGYKMSNGIYINVGYTLGFSNLNPNPNTSFKTNCITLKLGWLFCGHAGRKTTT